MTVGAARTPLAVLLELLWCFAAVAVFVALFGQGDGSAPSFVAVAAVVIGSFALSRALQISDLDETALRNAGAAASALALFLIAHIEYAPGAWPWELGWLARLFTDTSDVIQPGAHIIAGIIALSPLWLRGIIRGQSQIEFDGVLGSASLGLLAVIVAALATPDTREPVSWGAFALAYAAIALVALAVYRVPEPETSLGQFARRWTIALAAIAAMSVALALVAAAIDPGAFGFLAPIGAPLAYAGRILGTYVLGPIFWLLVLPFRFIGWLLGGLLPDNSSPMPRIIDQPPPEPERNRDRPLWYQILVWIFGGGAVAMALAIAAAVLWFAFRRFARSREHDPRERREDIEPASSLRDDLGDLLGALAGRFRRAPRPQSAVQIRRLYFEMLDAAAARGLERPASATPLQFAPLLDTHFTSGVPSSISRAFTASRYGDLPIDAAIVRDLQLRWNAVHHTGTEAQRTEL